MLIYHPAFDLYNCIYRLLQLLVNIEEKEVDLDRLRIWDFYLTFPREVKKISFPRSLLSLRKEILAYHPANPYEDLVDEKKIMERMKSYQLMALKCLTSYGFLDKDLLDKKIIKRTDKAIPDGLSVEIFRLSEGQELILKLIREFRDIPLGGEKGLKSRTGLLEFKYDAN